jgi:large subunit ribosomal protein L13
MQKTYYPKKQEITRKWFLMDASDKILGRLAVKVAVLLRGKHKSNFTPSMDMGDKVVVINAAKIKVTGRKLKDKLYRRYSGYPGGLKEIPLETMLSKKPTVVVRLAIERMLPRGPLGNKIIKNLRVYADDKHPHAGQNPQVIN